MRLAPRGSVGALISPTRSARWQKYSSQPGTRFPSPSHRIRTGFSARPHRSFIRFSRNKGGGITSEVLMPRLRFARAFLRLVLLRRRFEPSARKIEARQTVHLGLGLVGQAVALFRHFEIIVGAGHECLSIAVRRRRYNFVDVLARQ